MDCTVHKVNNCIIGNFFILLKSFIVRGDFDNSFPSYHHQVSRPGYLSFLTRMLHYRLYFCLFNINILRILASSCCDHGESSMCSLIVKTRQIQFVSTEMSSKSLSLSTITIKYFLARKIFCLNHQKYFLSTLCSTIVQKIIFRSQTMQMQMTSRIYQMLLCLVDVSNVQVT